MFSRAVQLFLAFALVWLGFTTQDQSALAALIAAEQLEVQIAADLQHCGASGSVDVQHAEDRPVQAQAEGGMDLPALLQQLADAQIALAVVRPGPHRMTAWLTPTLDGLRRPPRGLSVIA